MERAERSLLQPMGSEAKDLHPLLPSTPSTPSPFDELERRCAAFVRRDLHSSPSLPFFSKARLLIALLTLLPLRVAAATLIVLVYYFICRFCTFLSFHPNHDSDSVEDEEEEEEEKSFVHVRGWRRVVIVSSGRFLSRAMLFVMGFYWISASRCDEYLCTNDQEHERPGVIISNHVSYVDILYHMSSSFPSFVAKRSVARLPLVGIISKCLGCVYVQRESKSSDSKGVAGVVMDRIHKARQNKLAPIMLIFPEGTTTNGDYLLPFKSGAFLAKAPALPVVLKYPYERFSPAWDSISGVHHIILLLCQFVNHLEATHLPVYYPSQQEKDDPKLYANNLRKLMAMKGNLTVSEIGLAEKRVYHAALNGNGLPCDLHQKDD